MKTQGIQVTVVLIVASLAFACRPNNQTVNNELFASTSSNERALSVSNHQQVREYAQANGFAAVNWRAGMNVYYSASYGTDGEAGQAHGSLVADGSNFWFSQRDNTTTQMLLPPGRAHSTNGGGNGRSLWNFTTYANLIQQVAFGSSTASGLGLTDTPMYSGVSAALVDFTGGTAGGSTTYSNALRVTLKQSNRDGSQTDVKVFFAKDIGPVALEFSENGAVGGRFTYYVNAGGAQMASQSIGPMVSEPQLDQQFLE